MKPDYTREIPEEIRQKMIHIGTYQPDDARMRAELDALKEKIAVFCPPEAPKEEPPRPEKDACTIQEAERAAREIAREEIEKVRPFFASRRVKNEKQKPSGIAVAAFVISLVAAAFVVVRELVLR